MLLNYFTLKFMVLALVFKSNAILQYTNTICEFLAPVTPLKIEKRSFSVSLWGVTFYFNSSISYKYMVDSSHQPKLISPRRITLLFGSRVFILSLLIAFHYIPYFPHPTLSVLSLQIDQQTKPGAVLFFLTKSFLSTSRKQECLVCLL